MKYPQLPIGAFVAAFLVVTPLPWHWRARNVPTLAIIAWLFVLDIIYGVNALVWAGNVNNPIPVWCDITTKINIGASIALPIANMCLTMNLKTIASSKFARLDRRQRTVIDIVMCFGVPMIFMALHYIVQGHRFNVIEDFGCEPAIYESAPAIVLIWLPQLLPSFLSIIYAGLAIMYFIRRRMTFAAHLTSTGSALSKSQFVRLVALSVCQMCWGTTLTSLSFYSNVRSGLNPYVNWAFVHADFSAVWLTSTVEMSQFEMSFRMLLWWAIPTSSIIFFLFFSFGNDAKREYHQTISTFRTHILRQSVKESQISSKLSAANSDRHPVYVSMVELEQGPEEKKPSF